MENSEGIQKFHAATNQDLPSCTIGPRLIATIIDAVILTVIQQLLFILIEYALNAMVGRNPVLSLVVMCLLYSVTTYFYMVQPVVKNGYTIGKKLMGLRIVHSDAGENVSYPSIFLREFFVKGLTCFAFLITIPMYFFNKDGKFLHDILCNTRVVTINNV